MQLASSSSATTDRWFLRLCFLFILAYLGIGLFVGMSRTSETPSALLAEERAWKNAAGYADGRAIGEQHARRGVRAPNQSRLDVMAGHAWPAATASESRPGWITAFKIGFRAGFKKTPALPDEVAR